MVRLEELGKLKNYNYLIEIRAHDLSAFNVAPQPSTLPRVSNISTDLHEFLQASTSKGSTPLQPHIMLIL
jgi:hypothetical protein